MTFTGWPSEMIEFYSELEVNNTKEFWTANRDTFDRDVAAPMQDLLDELVEDHGQAKIFRPYRDVRFSKDKTPYKTHLGAAFHTVDGGGLYIGVSADGLRVGGGYYRMAPDQLQRFRAAVDADATGKELADVIAAVARPQAYEIHSDALKTAPRGWPKDHERIDLLRRKTLTWTRMAEPGPRVHTRKALAFVRESFVHGAPLVAWLDAHVGASAEPPRR